MDGEKTRIYVGGLGAGVTDDDLQKTFSALGEVLSVDVVRTKGRSFAYLDFLPASDKSLPKLFSTYNGCMWKGGKLRLEKAKEHYLVKLKREWQEESEHASSASDKCNEDAIKENDTLEKPKKPSPADKTQIHLFFPKLGKVKSLAQVGIGKHKYSFQRIQIPPIPTHFCDCEEHSLAFPPPNKKQSSEIDNASYEINEEEISIMNSVMNKIFERANPSKQVIERSESRNGKDEPVAAETGEEDCLSDEDNLIINVTNTKNDGMDMLGEMRAMMANQKQVSQKPNTFNEKPKKTAPLTKKRKSSQTEETSGNSPTRLDTQENSKKEVKSVTKQSGNTSLRSLKSTWKDLIGQKRDTSFSISDFIASIPQRKEAELNTDKKRKLEADKNIIANDCEQKDEEPKTDNLDSIFENHEKDQDLKKPTNDSPVKNEEDLIRTARGEFWRHKSSWTQLISTSSHTSFSISQIVPDLSLGKHEQQADTFHSQPEKQNLDDQIPVTVTKEATLSPMKKNIPERKRILSLGNLESDETCSFMRTEESIKEWKKAKASLSGSLNKKKRVVNESA